jgi:hypothetical protein
MHGRAPVAVRTYWTLNPVGAAGGIPPPDS